MATTVRTAPHVPPVLREQLVHESASMVRHLLTQGVRVPGTLVQAVDAAEGALASGAPLDVAALASTHERLARLAAPARPGTLHMLDDAVHHGRFRSLGPIPLVRTLVRIAMGCVLAFIVFSVLHVMKAQGPAGDMLVGVGWDSVLEQAFWLAAAGIGASFAILFQLNDAIADRTYDPDLAQSYWIKFFLGVVAGFILVALVPVEGEGTAGALAKPTIALLGGFSASAVYRILTRMVEALESMFSGGAKEEAAAREKAANARAAEDTSQARIAMAGGLVQLQQQIAAGASTDEVSARLGEIVASLAPAGDAPNPAAPARIPAMAIAPAPADAAGDGEQSADGVEAAAAAKA